MIKFRKYFNNLYLEKYSGTEEVIKIPSEYNKEKVRGIYSDAFFGNNNVKTIILPDTIEIIGHRAFKNCLNLENIILSKNLTGIGNDAFSETNIKELEIPENVTDLKNCFGICNNLEKVTIKSDVLKNSNLHIFTGCKNLKEINLKKIEYHQLDILDNCKSLEKITIETGDIVAIDNVLYNKEGNVLFHYPHGLKNKTYKIKNNIKIIEQYAFYKNKYLEKLILNDNLLEIKHHGISECPNLKNIFFNKNIEKLNDNFILKLDKIKTIDLSNTNIKTIDQDLIQPELFNDLKMIIIPNSLKNINISYNNKEFKKLLRIAQPKENFNKEMQEFIESNNVALYSPTLEELIEEGKSFHEANTILNKLER